jgi:hypothetical protein
MLGMSGSTPPVYGNPRLGGSKSSSPPIFGDPKTSQLAALIAASPTASAAAAAAAQALGFALGLDPGSIKCSTPVCDATEQTNLLLTLLDSIYSTVDRLFPVITIAGTHTTAASATSLLKPRAFCRVYWAQKHKGIPFGGKPVDPVTLNIHLLQLKDIYLMLGLDQSIEPLFLLLSPPTTTMPSTTSPPA